MPRILIVDDSITARIGLRQALEEGDPNVEVVGEAATGAQALRMVRDLHPDMVTMDVRMGREDGVEITAAIMREAPTPILIVTAMEPRDPALVFRSLEAGALEVLAKPRGGPSGKSDRQTLVRTVRALAGVPVVTRRARDTKTSLVPDAPTAPVAQTGLVVVGASTGGPPLLHQVLAKVPPPLSVPLVVIQHVMPGFAHGLVDWLRSVTGHSIVLCKQPTRMMPGEIYFAPDHHHLQLVDGSTIAPFSGPPRRFQRPSVDELFESAARHRPSSTLALVLTGMGDDGTDGMLALRRAGARTVAQHPSTCVADSMPTKAIEAGAAGEVLGPGGIVSLLSSLGRNGFRPRGEVA